MKILFLITDLGRGGAERSIIDLCRQFKHYDDVECVIGALFRNNEFEQETKDLRVEYLDYKPNSLFKKSYTPKYHSLIKEYQPDIIHTNRYLAEYLSSEKIYHDATYVCHGRDNMVQLKNLSYKTLLNKTHFLNFLEKQQIIRRKYSKKKVYFVANSTHTKQYYDRVLPKMQHKNVQIIHNAIEYNKFYTERNFEQINEPIKIVNVGSFQAKKNQSFIIEIAKVLNSKGIKFQIDLLGDGKLKSSVEQKIKDEGLQNIIFCQGIVKDVPLWLKSSDIYLHTAWYEPFGIVLLEAMASGLPIVCLDGKGNRDIIKDNYNGIFLKKQDPELFAKSIMSLIEDKELRKTLATNGQKYSYTFDIVQKANEYYTFYKNILNA